MNLEEHPQTINMACNHLRSKQHFRSEDLMWWMIYPSVENHVQNDVLSLVVTYLEDMMGTIKIVRARLSCMTSMMADELQRRVKGRLHRQVLLPLQPRLMKNLMVPRNSNLMKSMVNRGLRRQQVRRRRPSSRSPWTLTRMTSNGWRRTRTGGEGPFG